MRGNDSKVLTATGAVKASPGAIYAMTLVAGSDAATVILDDSLAGSGTEKWRLSATAGMSVSICFGERGLLFATGIYATTSGTGEQFSVQYE